MTEKHGSGATAQDEPHIRRWFNQGDYPDVPIFEGAHCSIAMAGCGPCSLAHALIALGADVTPPVVLAALNEKYPEHQWFALGTLNGYLGPLARDAYGLHARTLWPLHGEGHVGAAGAEASDAVLSRMLAGAQAQEGDEVLSSAAGITPASSEAGDSARRDDPQDHATPADDPTQAELVFDQVLSALEAGHVVILSAHGDVFRAPDGRPYDGIGHYVCLYGIDSHGRIIVADSNEHADEVGGFAGGENPYTIEQARKLVSCSVAFPQRHEVVELWR